MGLLVLVVALAAVAAWAWRDPTEPPPPPGGDQPNGGAVGAIPATGTHTDATGGTSETGSYDPDSAPAGTTRIQVGDATTDDHRPCVLEVTVVAEIDGRTEPVAFTEVAAILTELDMASASSRTDARGIVAYTFVGGHEQPVRCVAGVGGQLEVVLDADAPIRRTITIAPKVVATGRVIDPTNVGIADADVLLLRWPHSKHDRGSLWSIARTDRNGSFRIPLAVGGQLGARHPDYASSRLHMVRPSLQKGVGNDPSQPPPTQVFELLLHNGSATIVGTVRSGGRPIANAEVAVHALAPNASEATRIGPPYRTHTRADGSFRLTGVPPGPVRWFADQPRQSAAPLGWSEGTAQVAIRGSNRLDIELPAAATMQGTVVSQSTGKPIGGAIVSAGTPGTLCYRTTETAADGSYVLDNLGHGETYVQAEFETQQASATVSLRPGEVTAWHASLSVAAQSQQLTGIVLDEADTPLAGWQVIVRQKGLDPTGTRTGDDGRFAIPVRRKGDLDVRCYAPDRRPTSFADARQSNCKVSEQVVLRTGQVGRTMLTGRVLGSNATGAVARIGCWHQQSREYARYTSNSDGSFTIRDVPVGTVNVTIEFQGHVAHESGDLQLQPNVPVDLGTVQLELGGGLFGSVIGPAGVAPAECSLSILVSEPRRRLTAEYFDGAYRFVEVPAGKHTLVVQAKDLAAASFPITIQAGADLPRDVELQVGIKRPIRVHVPAAAGYRVTLSMHAQASTPGWIATGQVQRHRPGVAGYALFDTCMVAGEYTVRAVTPQGYEAEGTLRYTHDETEPFVIELAPR